MNQNSIMEEILREFRLKWSETPQIFLDYDGTLVPIQPDSEKASADRDLLELLYDLKKVFDLWIVTGRTLRSIRGFIGDGFNIVGLHGLEVQEAGGSVWSDPVISNYRSSFREIIDSSRSIEESFPGVRIADKVGAVSFSTWGMKDKDISGLESFLEALSKKYGLETYLGHKIFEIRIPGINKGTAIRKLRNSKTAVIIGDDVTDEDAFRMNSDAITVKVGPGDSSALYRLPDFVSVRTLLKEMLLQNPETS